MHCRCTVDALVRLSPAYCTPGPRQRTQRAPIKKDISNSLSLHPFIHHYPSLHLQLSTSVPPFGSVFISQSCLQLIPPFELLEVSSVFKKAPSVTVLFAPNLQSVLELFDQSPLPASFQNSASPGVKVTTTNTRAITRTQLSPSLLAPLRDYVALSRALPLPATIRDQIALENPLGLDLNQTIERSDHLSVNKSIQQR